VIIIIIIKIFFITLLEWCDKIKLSNLLLPRKLRKLPAREKIFLERMTSDRKLKASREGSK